MPPTQKKKFKQKNVSTVQAIQINLALKEVIRYIQSGNKMAAKGDWLITDGSQTWTVNQELFAKNYTETDTPGMFSENPVEAEVLYSYVDTAGNKRTVTEEAFKAEYVEE